MRRYILAVAILGVLGAALTTYADPDAQPATAVTAGEVKADAKAVDKPPVAEPTDAKGVVETGKEAVQAAKDGRWWYFSALVLMVLMFILKFLGDEGRLGFWKKLGRWRYIISPVLSIVAALLAAFQGGLSFDAALGVFTSSYATSSLQELYEHGILGKPRKSASP